jgi:hypothetical protein
LNEGSQLAQDQHPADALGETLGRINTLLSAIGAMFDPGRDTFAVNEAYVMHSLLAAQGLVATAQVSLGTLHESCDLSLLSHPQVTPETLHGEAEQQPAEDSSPEEPPDVEPIPYTPLSSRRFVEDVTSSVANQEFAEPRTARESTPPADDRRVLQEGFAQSYLELLRKLTAAEIFAAEQQALSPPGTPHQLLPLLRSLREDFQKIHSAA